MEDLEQVVESLDKPSIKGEDIYVENDPSELERMLGVLPDASEEKDQEEEQKEVLDKEQPESSLEETYNSQDPINKELLLTDFMEEDKEVFSYLKKEGLYFVIESLPKEDSQAIRKVVRSPQYIFRYPKLHLKDFLLGYKEVKLDSNSVEYEMFFPEYSISFEVPISYKYCNTSQSFKEYFEDLVLRNRPTLLKKDIYDSFITITSLKVIETGVLELSIPDKGTVRYSQTDYNLSFYSLLEYIRDLSDQGSDKIEIAAIPRFFNPIN